MDFVKIFFSSVGSIFVLFFLTKLIGNKQVSQLNLFDYINGITIGSIAAEFATSLESDFWKPLLAMVIYALVTVLIDLLSQKSIRLRRLFEGRCYILMEHGKLYYQNFKKARINLNEFLIQCRDNGYFTLSDLDTVLMEANGKLSFLPIAEATPLTPKDMNLTPDKQDPAVPVILDSNIFPKSLQAVGKNVQWLEQQLEQQKIKAKDVFLAVHETGGSLLVYKKETTRQKQSRFE